MQLALRSTPVCRSQEHLCYVPLLGGQVPSDSIQTNLCMFFKVLRPLFGTFTALTVHGGSASPVVFSLGNVRLWIISPKPCSTPSTMGLFSCAEKSLPKAHVRPRTQDIALSGNGGLCTLDKQMSLFGMGGGALSGAIASCRGNDRTGHLPTSCAPGDPFTDHWWLFCLAGRGGGVVNAPRLWSDLGCRNG